MIQSFGWTQHQAFEQHDCQEFIRILFDAIEKTFAGNKNEHFISDIYGGISQNYVKCLECSSESIRDENFLDIGLTVKNHFDKIYNDNILKAFQNYLKPELLSGENQYFCSNCNKKVFSFFSGGSICFLPFFFN